MLDVVHAADVMVEQSGSFQQREDALVAELAVTRVKLEQLVAQAQEGIQILPGLPDCGQVRCQSAGTLRQAGLIPQQGAIEGSAQFARGPRPDWHAAP